MSSSSANVTLASFLFGNIDEDGRLDTDILDSEAKERLSSLTQLGLGEFVDELVGDSLPRKTESDSASDSDGGDKRSRGSQSNSPGNLLNNL